MRTRKSLSVYVDESGNFGDTGDPARYCMVTLVFHDIAVDVDSQAKAYYNGIYNAGADPESMSFHTAPLIRQEDQFSAMSRNMRGKKKFFGSPRDFKRNVLRKIKCKEID